MQSLTDTKGKGTYLNAITIELFYPGYSGFITKENHPVSKEQLDFISQRFKEHGFVPRYSDNEKVYYTTTSLSFKFKKTDIKINESIDSKDDTSPEAKAYLEKEHGLSSTDVQDWIQDILDEYGMVFRVKIERDSVFKICISIELFYPYDDGRRYPGYITADNHPVPKEQINFLNERMKEHEFNPRFSEEIYYPVTCTYLAFRFRKNIIYN